jgi:hypothetical protein
MINSYITLRLMYKLSKLGHIFLVKFFIIGLVMDETKIYINLKGTFGINLILK